LERELKEVAAEIADELAMTMLQRRRFLSACGGEAVVAKAAPQLPVKSNGYDSEDDVFAGQVEPDSQE
jgi:hypothetical protein